jgi:hypothetical protein
MGVPASAAVDCAAPLIPFLIAALARISAPPFSLTLCTKTEHIRWHLPCSHQPSGRCAFHADCKRRECRLRQVGARLRERAVLTLSCARTILRSGAGLGAVLSLSALLVPLASTAARADGMAVGGCVGTRYSITCVTRWGGYSDPYIRLVPHQTEAEKAHSAEHDRRWQAHCKPVVVQDPYGVPRYEYAARGCEFGVVE